MNIVVCCKHVPDATADRGFAADTTVDREGVDGLLSELDEYAVEQALQIKEAGDGSDQVTVLTMGPDQAGDAIRKSLQMGADAGVHVCDEALAGSDALATSLVLAEAVRKVGTESGFDLVVCGMASTDGGMSVVPAMLAERLELPQVTFASEVTLADGVVRIRRDGDAATEHVEGTPPLVLSVTDQSGEARYPSFKGIMAAKKKPVQTWSLADLEVPTDQVGADAAWTRVESADARPPRTKGEVVTDEDGSAATALTEFLVSKKFV